MNYAPRITVSYADASGVLAEWADTCEHMCVYEHSADGKVSQTHLHILMLGCNLGKEALKRRFYKMLPDETRKGNALWKWESERPPDRSFITYMSKGKLCAMFLKNFPQAEIEDLRSKWVEPTVRQISQKNTKSVKSKPSSDEWDQLLKDAYLHYKEVPHYTLDSVRSFTMSWYLKRDGRLPNVGVYKRNASSIYVRLEDIHPVHGTPTSVALENLKNLWW